MLEEQRAPNPNPNPQPPNPQYQQTDDVEGGSPELFMQGLERQVDTLSPLVRVNAVAPATVVKGSAMFPRDRVIGSLAKYKIPFRGSEATESLVAKLAQFYADRTLTQSPITPADQAEAFFLLVSNRLSKTVGQVITVDGGLHEAFLR